MSLLPPKIFCRNGDFDSTTHCTDGLGSLLFLHSPGTRKDPFNFGRVSTHRRSRRPSRLDLVWTRGRGGLSGLCGLRPMVLFGATSAVGHRGHRLWPPPGSHRQRCAKGTMGLRHAWSREKGRRRGDGQAAERKTLVVRFWQQGPTRLTRPHQRQTQHKCCPTARGGITTNRASKDL